MQELAALVPQLQQDAWDRYETQGQALLDQYKLLQGQDEDAYGQWRDRVEDWQDASRQARGRYESLEQQDYSNYNDQKNYDSFVLFTPMHDLYLLFTLYPAKYKPLK